MARHKKIYLLFPLVLFLLSCRTESLFNRLGEDYLPYDNVNSSWEYRVAGEDTLTVEWKVKTKAIYNGREASLIESTEEDFYYSTGPDALYEFVSRTVFSLGEDLVLEERWRPRVEKPLNLGNRWEDDFNNQVIQQGITYSIESSLTGVVEEIETVSTPVDFFDECYRVSIVSTSTITFPSGITEEDVIRVQEWYAPGVGMVRREVEGGEVWELTNYLVL
jgi:hypothetical protein